MDNLIFIALVIIVQGLLCFGCGTWLGVHYGKIHAKNELDVDTLHNNAHGGALLIGFIAYMIFRFLSSQGFEQVAGWGFISFPIGLIYGYLKRIRM